MELELGNISGYQCLMFFYLGFRARNIFHVSVSASG